MTGPGMTGVERLARTVVDRVGLGRSVIAIVGAPGSGKSTLAERLEADLNALNPGSAAVLSMDGYHFDDDVLVARGLRARKGAPETFDVGGLLHMLGRLQRNEEDEIACQAPSWNENMKCFLDLAINSENIGRPCSHY